MIRVHVKLTYQSQLENNVTLSSIELIDLNGLLPISSNASTTSNNETVSSEAHLCSFTTDVSPLAVSANGYNNITARDYAYSWYNKRNPTYSTYYAEKNGCNVADSSCWTKWNDCTNFVSQALYSGGMKFRTGSNYTSNDAWQFGPL